MKKRTTQGSATSDFRLYSRGEFLRGLSLSVAGSVLIGPLLRKLYAEVEGHVQPARFLFVLEGNGCPPNQIHPTNLNLQPMGKRERTVEERFGAGDLPRALQPVSKHVDRMLILQGISGRIAGAGHSTYYGALGCYNTRDAKHILGPTVDCALGIRNPALFENIVLGISQRTNLDITFNCSASAAETPVATILNPQVAYKRMFAAIGDRKGLAVQSHLLDYVKDDIRAVRRRFGSVEKEKLDRYLSAYEQIGQRHSAIAGLDPDVRHRIKPMTEKYLSGNPVDRLECHFEMATNALVTGLTNVATIASGVGHQDFSIVFDKLGVGMEKHAIGHALYNNESVALDASQKIRAFHFEQIARTLEKLQNIPEGSGTMLDNTVIVYLSDNANEHHTSCLEWPYVMLGGNPRLKLGGRCITYADFDNKGHRTINAIHNTLLHAAGHPVNDFGFKVPGLNYGVQEGPLSELLA
jgi:hypothetical protein